MALNLTMNQPTGLGDTNPDGQSTKLGDDFIAASQKFAHILYKALCEEETGNLFFSPASIQIALVLISLGAKGKTEEEILSLLQLSKNKNKWLTDVKCLVDIFTGQDALKVATELFIEQCYKLREDYIEAAKSYLKSQTKLLDFKSGPEAAEASRNHINSWVLEKTNNKINNLLEKGSVTTATRLVVVNAIHFKNAWKNEFKARNTEDRPFYLSQNSSVPVSTMFINEYFFYTETDTFQALEMPYKGDEFRMLILLPKEIEGLTDLEKQLSDVNLSELSRKMSSQKVNVYFPKLKLEQYFDLNDILKKIGVQSMFDETVVDFSGIFEEGQDPLVVSKVVHKSYVDVNEKGTEAAAATAIMMVACCASFPVAHPVTFKVDHPFIFYILHNDMILFMSKITNIKSA